MADAGTDLTITRKGTGEFEVAEGGHFFYLYNNPLKGWEVYRRDKLDPRSKAYFWINILGTPKANQLLSAVVTKEHYRHK